MRILAWMGMKVNSAPFSGRCLPLMRRIAKKHEVHLVGIGKIDEDKLKGTKIHFIEGKNAINTYRKNLFEALKCDYDIIHGFKSVWFSGGISYLLSRLKSKPFFLDIDDYEAYASFNPEISKIKHLFGKECENFLVKKANTVTVASYKLREIFGGYYLPNSCELNEFNPKKYKGENIRGCYNIKDNEIVINWTGIMYKSTNCELILKALKIMKGQAKLILVGCGEKLREYRMIAKNLKIDDKVIFTGYVTGNKLKEIYAATDVGVIPLKDTKFDWCKSPIKLYEYMAMEIPIVSTNVGEPMFKIYESGCGVVVENNPKALANALDKFYEMSPEERKKIGKRGRKFLEKKQNWDIVSKKLLKLYEQIVN
ncbi:glycosyltransferase family 4 protein [Archaeoglobus sp.]